MAKKYKTTLSSFLYKTGVKQTDAKNYRSTYTAFSNSVACERRRFRHLLHVWIVERNCRYRYNNVAGAVNHGDVQNRPTDIIHDLVIIRTT